MSIKYKLSSAQWDKIKDFLPGGKESDPGRSAEDNRRFIEAVLWIGENGCEWRSLPEEFGNWNSVFQRFKRWANKGVWQIIFNILAVSADTKWLMIDSTIVRAHQHCAGALKKWRARALGRSRGGFTAKIHTTCNNHGKPLRFILTGEEVSDCLKATELLNDFASEKVEAVIADKGYDADYIVSAIENDLSSEAVIPPKINRKVLRHYNKELYKQRNLIERLFNRIKSFRRVATRYDKTSVSFLSFIQIACVFILGK